MKVGGELVIAAHLSHTTGRSLVKHHSGIELMNHVDVVVGLNLHQRTQTKSLHHSYSPTKICLFLLQVFKINEIGRESCRERVLRLV